MNSNFLIILITPFMFSLLNNQEMVNDYDDILSKTIITEKQFVVDSLNYLYTNKYKFQKTSETKQNTHLQIRNLPCVMVGNQIKKVTEIYYAGQKFHIQDFYTISTVPTSDKSTLAIPQVTNSQSQSSSQPLESSNKESKDSEKLNTKKFCLFKKSRGKGQTQKRNTKNVPKNFCKAFLHFLSIEKNRKTDKQKINNCINYLKNLTGDKKYYNNPIILKIISSNACKELFRLFLQEHAKNWIERSKMDNKKVHLDAIQIYLRLYEKKTFLQGDQDQQQQI